MANPSRFLDAFLSLAVSSLCGRCLLSAGGDDSDADRLFLCRRRNDDGDCESSESISASDVRYLRPGVEAAMD